MMMTRRHLTFGLALLLLVGLCCGELSAEGRREWVDGQWVQSAPPAEGTAEGELSLVRDLYDVAHYSKVVKAARKFTERYPDSDAYEEVCLLAGQAEMQRHRYFQAYEWFEKQLDQFPAGRYSDRALQHEYDVAEAFLGGAKRIVFGALRLNATDEALEILSRVAEHAPGTELAARCLVRVGDHYYDRRQWVDAAEAYDVLLRLMPHSPRAEHAMLRAAQATYASFEGLAFDDTPLLDAEQRFASFAATYPAAADRAGVAQTLRQIAATRAEKLLSTARFYERTHKPSAAAFYYRQCMTELPQTASAGAAREALCRLGEIAPVRPATPLPLKEDTN